MRLDLLITAFHALILWVMVRGLSSLAISSGAQNLWALAGSVAVAVLASTAVAAWLSGTAAQPGARQIRRLLPAPTLGAVVTGLLVSANGGSSAQILVSSFAWLLGATIALVGLSLTKNLRLSRSAV